MPIVKIFLESDVYMRLGEMAIDERRPIPWQAEIVLRKALRLTVPSPSVHPIGVENE